MRPLKVPGIQHPQGGQVPATGAGVGLVYDELSLGPVKESNVVQCLCQHLPTPRAVAAL